MTTTKTTAPHPAAKVVQQIERIDADRIEHNNRGDAGPRMPAPKAGPVNPARPR